MTITHIEGARFITVDGSNGQQVAVSDELGGLVGRLVVSGRDRLFRNAAIPLTTRRIDVGAQTRIDLTSKTAYVDHADVGLGDQCLLTVSADRIDDGAVALPDHGVAWCTRPTTVVDGTTATTTWRVAPPLLCTFTRALLLDDDGSVTARFSLTNGGAAAMPMFWSSHDMLPLTDDVRCALDPGTPFVVFAQSGVVPAAGVHRWPHLRLDDGAMIDVASPATVARARGPFSLKLFSQEPCGALIVEDARGALRITGDGTRAGLWINEGGWAPDALRAKGVRYRSMCPERCIGGATDKVSEGLAQQTCETIAPGETRRWAMRYAPG